MDVALICHHREAPVVTDATFTHKAEAQDRPSASAAITPTPMCLPPEIMDMIIGHADDNRTLYNCSLVCRAWLLSSRFYLFREVQLASSAAYDLFVAQVLHNDHMRPYLGDILSFEINGFGATSPSPRSRSLSTACRLFLFHFSGHMLQLRRLSISNIHWKLPLPARYEPFLGSGFPKLQTLELARCELLSPLFLQRIISSLPLLTRLALSYLTFAMPPGYTRLCPDSAQRHALQSLRIHYHRDKDQWLDSFLPWLSSRIQLSSLRALDFCATAHLPSSRGEIVLSQSHVDFLRQVAPTVETLDVNHPSAPYRFPLEDFANLVTLNVHVRDTIINPTWAPLCQFLRGASSTLHALRIHGLSTHALSTSKQAWRGLCVTAEGLDGVDEIFGMQGYDNLREVVLSVSGTSPQETSSEREELLADLQRRLPILHRRNVVRLIFTG
ncbi:hypothetical protein C8Q80DRAFT_681062 [Daedaleopsis nitida]|nr:hypothetical protein C8Q80DRAFT_681062 [Daedaleopsis nitida]